MARDSNRKDKKERERLTRFSDRLVAINRVSKTVKGGKHFGLQLWLLLVIKRPCWIW